MNLQFGPVGNVFAWFLMNDSNMIVARGWNEDEATAREEADGALLLHAARDV